MLETCNITIPNVSRDKKRSFWIPTTLWVYGKKTRVTALVDSGATTNLIDKRFVEQNHLVTNKIAYPFPITNADGTENNQGYITEYVRAYMVIGDHASTHHFYVTNLSGKDVMIGYTFLHKHNPSIDWEKGEWQFTRCPEACTNKRVQRQKFSELDYAELSTNLP